MLLFHTVICQKSQPAKSPELEKRQALVKPQNGANSFDYDQTRQQVLQHQLFITYEYSEGMEQFCARQPRAKTASCSVVKCYPSTRKKSLRTRASWECMPLQKEYVINSNTSSSKFAQHMSIFHLQSCVFWRSRLRSLCRACIFCCNRWSDPMINRL